MRRILSKPALLVLLMLLLLLFTACGGGQNTEKNAGGEGAEITELTVSAAASLKDALDEAKALFEDREQIKVNANYAASGTLQHQIENGAPTDIFISAAKKQMDALEEKDLIIAETREYIFSNDLVLIIPKDVSGIVKSFEDLTREGIKISIGEPEVVPAGKYAQQTLTNLGIWEEVSPKIIYAKDVRQVLHYIETGDVDAGMVYGSDAVVSDKVTVVATAEDSLHDEIVYPVAVIKASQNQEAASAFIAFLKEPETVKIFERYGFIVK